MGAMRGYASYSSARIWRVRGGARLSESSVLICRREYLCAFHFNRDIAARHVISVLIVVVSFRVIRAVRDYINNHAF